MEFSSLTRRPTDWNSCRMDALERPVYGSHVSAHEGLLPKDFFTVADYCRILNIELFLFSPSEINYLISLSGMTKNYLCLGNSRFVLFLIYLANP